MYVSDKEMTILRTYMKAVLSAYRRNDDMDLTSLLDMFRADDGLHKCAREILLSIYKYLDI